MNQSYLVNIFHFISCYEVTSGWVAANFEYTTARKTTKSYSANYEQRGKENYYRMKKDKRTPAKKVEKEVREELKDKLLESMKDLG